MKKSIGSDVIFSCLCGWPKRKQKIEMKEYDAILGFFIKNLIPVNFKAKIFLNV